jgi:hypothetical protein
MPVKLIWRGGIIVCPTFQPQSKNSFILHLLIPVPINCRRNGVVVTNSVAHQSSSSNSHSHSVAAPVIDDAHVLQYTFHDDEFVPKRLMHRSKCV